MYVTYMTNDLGGPTHSVYSYVPYQGEVRTPQKVLRDWSKNRNRKEHRTQCQYGYSQ